MRGACGTGIVFGLDYVDWTVENLECTHRRNMAPEHISESLVHWTGRKKSDDEAFAALKNICNERELWLAYCPTYGIVGFQEKINMVCFTDIPLHLSAFHCSQFGRFGIGFHKAKMIEYGANPVFYTTNTHFNRIVQLTSLVNRMHDLEKDREWKEELEKYHFKEQETMTLIDLYGFLQEYSHNDKLPYYQREWRLIFHMQPFAGGSTPQTPGMTCFRIKDGISHPTFKFSEKDVSQIIVTRAFAKQGAQIAVPFGCEVKIYEDEVETTP
jgi:hypothetical protein